MDLKVKNKAQLKEIAEQINLAGYEELNKVDLLGLIEKTLEENPELIKLLEEPKITIDEKIVEEVKKTHGVDVKTEIKKIIKKEKENTIPNLPDSVYRKWKEYLKKNGLTAKEFLLRYPNHPEKEIIKTL